MIDPIEFVKKERELQSSSTPAQWLKHLKGAYEQTLELLEVSSTQATADMVALVWAINEGYAKLKPHHPFDSGPHMISIIYGGPFAQMDYASGRPLEPVFRDYPIEMMMVENMPFIPRLTDELRRELDLAHRDNAILIG